MKIKGREYQFDGVSIHYFVGDIIKRNYDKLIRIYTNDLRGRKAKLNGEGRRR